MKRGKICVSTGETDASSVNLAVQPILGLVDVIEVRLDAMKVPEVAKCCSLINKPLLFTHRPIWEGGAFSGFEDDRIGPLFEAVELQAAYVDFELRADPLLRQQLLDAMQTTPTRMILSWHDFTSTPDTDDLHDILQQMMDSGAQIGKIVTLATNITDVLRVLRLQETALERNFSLSCFCMGEVGLISRLVTLYLGGYMTYGAVSSEQATAPGQLEVSRLDTLVSNLEGNNSRILR